MLPTAPFGEAKSYSTDHLTESGAAAAFTRSSNAFCRHAFSPFDLEAVPTLFGGKVGKGGLHSEKRCDQKRSSFVPSLDARPLRVGHS